MQPSSFHSLLIEKDRSQKVERGFYDYCGEKLEPTR
jgi:hypothetical protein